MGPHEIIAGRRTERAARVDVARAFVDGLDPSLGVRAAVVFGSVARGDFNLWSDIDVLVVADHTPARYLDHDEALGRRPAGVEAVLWSPRQWQAAVGAKNPIAVESIEHGLWLTGSPAALG